MLRRRRTVFVVLVLCTCLVLFYFNQANHPLGLKDPSGKAKPVPVDSHAHLKNPLTDITCQINSQVVQNIGMLDTASKDDRQQSVRLTWQQIATNPDLQPWIKNVDCKLNPQTKRVYVPFDHIKSYFDVEGSLLDGAGKFIWSHSYAKIDQTLKSQPYDWTGTFLNWANMRNVENRGRVKYVSAKEGVPITTQWNEAGHMYPTQIGQFGLNNWSKYKQKAAASKVEDILLEDGKPRRQDYSEDIAGGEDKWTGNVIKVSSDNCVHFDEGEATMEIGVDVSVDDLFGWDLKTEDNVTVSLDVKLPSNKKFALRYVPTDKFDVVQKSNVIQYGYGSVFLRNSNAAKTGNIEHGWKLFTRNVYIDIAKGLGTNMTSKLMTAPGNTKQDRTLHLERIRFQGVGCVTNITVFKSGLGNLRQFIQAADWFAAHQREGGWPVGVAFNVNSWKYPRAKAVPSGWNGAMALGHGLSVLSRAHSATDKNSYLELGAQALDLFVKDTTDGGVMSRFMGQHVWYQEYPTDPPAYILNGFIFSLLGLYDFWQATVGRPDLEVESNRSQQLFSEGLESLVSLLPLFDTGSGSVYDLRHFTMPGTPPKIARWDYHALHVNQLYVMSTITKKLHRDHEEFVSNSDKDVRTQLLLSTAKRWQGYMYGKRADHN